MKKLILLLYFGLLYSCSSEEPCEPFPILITSKLSEFTYVSATICGDFFIN